MSLDEQFLWDRIGFFGFYFVKSIQSFQKGSPVNMLSDWVGYHIIVFFVLLFSSFFSKEGLSLYSVIILSLS